MSGRRSRTKGAAFERRISKELADIWPDAKRGIGQTRSGSEVADVEGTPFWVEAKHRKRPSLMAAWAQATQATDGRPVLVVMRKDRGQILVTMELCEFKRIMGVADASPKGALDNE